VRAPLVEYGPYGPWDAEATAVERAGGTLEIVTIERFADDPPDADVLLNVWAIAAPARGEPSPGLVNATARA
jgi:hypothetical protein